MFESKTSVISQETECFPKKIKITAVLVAGLFVSSPLEIEALANNYGVTTDKKDCVSYGSTKPAIYPDQFRQFESRALQVLDDITYDRRGSESVEVLKLINKINEYRVSGNVDNLNEWASRLSEIAARKTD